MFSFLSKNVVGRRDLFNRDSIEVVCLIKYPSFIRFISSNSTNKDSFRVSYLISSCGLSQDKAISISKLVKFKTCTNPDSVLALLRNYGFMDTHISKFVENYPHLLSLKADKNLKPKLEFFHSLGFTGLDLVKLLCEDPHILMRSLEKQLIPAVAFLKSVIHTDNNVISAIRRSRWILTNNHQHALKPNIEVLRAQGVPDLNISKLLVKQPRTLCNRTESFKLAVEEVLKLKFNPSKVVFCEAVRAFLSLTKSNREAKYKVFNRWGWSEDDINSAFRIQPFCLMLSEKNIMHTMEFFVKKMGYDPIYVAKHPSLLTYSIEKRLIPRCSVIKILISNGLVKKDCGLPSVLAMNEEDFLLKYVTEFKEDIPGLLSVYQGEGRRMV